MLSLKSNIGTPPVATEFRLAPNAATVSPTIETRHLHPDDLNIS